MLEAGLGSLVDVAELVEGPVRQPRRQLVHIDTGSVPRWWQCAAAVRPPPAAVQAPPAGLAVAEAVAAGAAPVAVVDARLDVAGVRVLHLAGCTEVAHVAPGGGRSGAGTAVINQLSRL